MRVQAVKGRAAYAKMLVRQEPVQLQVDCGASANILPSKHVEDVELSPCSQSLVMWNGTKIKPVGTFSLVCFPSTTHLSRYVQDCMGLRSKPRRLYSAVLFIGTFCYAYFPSQTSGLCSAFSSVPC